jgi:hypothetical protein
MSNRCNCDLKEFGDDVFFTYCPKCGCYYPNLFIGEQYLPSGEDTPLRELISHLIYQKPGIEIKGEIKSPASSSGGVLWRKIEKAIKASDICLFDITEKRFNVGYELGYSIGEKKAILLCYCITEKKPEYFSQWSFLDSPPKVDKEYQKLIRLKIKLATFVHSKTETNDIMKKCSKQNIVGNFNKVCDKFEQELLKFDHHSNITDLYGEYDKYTGTKFPKENSVVVITSSKYKKMFQSIKKPSNIKKFEVKCPTDIATFESDCSEIILNIFKDLLYKYKHMFGHLVDSKDDLSEEEFKLHNFFVALFGGLMTHRGRKYCRFFAHKENTIDTFSDRKPEKRYSDIKDAKEKIIELLEGIK